MRFAIVFISLLFLVQLEAQLCPERQCMNPISHTCEDEVRCFANPCTINNGGCEGICAANYCGGCNAVCEGDSCGTPGVDCAALRCACGLCPDGAGVSNFGCCGTCTMEDDGIGGLECSGIIPLDRTCPIVSSCGGFDHCDVYHDGCNDCFCNEDGTEACTEKACVTDGIPICLECEFEYRFNANHECVAKKTCMNASYCDIADGFRCTEDPMCGGTPELYGSFCIDPPKVCVDKEHRCTTDEDCDIANGYECSGFNNQARLVCIKYE
eukprot:403991_1